MRILINQTCVVLPVRLLFSFVPWVPFSSVKLVGFRLLRKNLSGRNERLGNLSAISNVRLGVDVAVEDGGSRGVAVTFVGDGSVPIDKFGFAVAGIAAVICGRALIGDEASIDRVRAGFLINDRNRCRHKSSGISELSKSNSRNCRKP